MGQPEEQLLARLRAFCFPGGEDAARAISAIRYTQRGEMCSAPGAKWVPFTAEEEIDTRRSRFCWVARYKGGKLGTISVTDAYEEGHGRLVVKLGGVIPVKKMTGPDLDRGELQRYLSSIVLCPPAVLNHGSLEWTPVGPLTLRVRDREDPTGATVDLDFAEDGRPLGCRADRPRAVGNATVPTPWFATCGEFRELEGIRFASRLEVSWQLPEGPYAYFRGEIASFTPLR